MDQRARNTRVPHQRLLVIIGAVLVIVGAWSPNVSGDAMSPATRQAAPAARSPRSAPGTADHTVQPPPSDASHADKPAAPVVLRGTITAADRGLYQAHVFQVPPDTARIDIEFIHERLPGLQVELGVYDPDRFRGASRFSKTTFFIATTTASASYFPGPLPPGPWRLSFGIPTIRDGDASPWEATITFTPTHSSVLAAAPPHAPEGPRWFAGDLHSHTWHSDGFRCDDGRGGTRGCAVFEVALAARARGLDFMAVTDHNTTSHHQDLINVQVGFPELLLVGGQEVTTFNGHAHVFGTREPVDFRTGTNGWTATDFFDQARHAGGFVSINHPGRDTGERCTGCGWDAPNTDYVKVTAIEVVNGANAEGPRAGSHFWHARLNDGYRLVGIGGSDDHTAGSRIGTPTTMVYATELSERAVLDGIRRGRVYIRTRGPIGPAVDFTLIPANGAPVPMGDTVAAPAVHAGAQLRIHLEGAAGQTLQVLRRGELVQALERRVESDAAEFSLPVAPTAGDWFLVHVRDAKGLTLITNPIFVH